MKIFSVIIINGDEFLQRLSILCTIILSVDPAHIMAENGDTMAAMRSHARLLIINALKVRTNK